ncbi:MAG: SHD1 domain-containing protein [Planctomycetota bacterium]
MSSRIVLLWVCLPIVWNVVGLRPGWSQELIQAPEDMVRYRLSNLREENSPLGRQIAFDYKKVRDGNGSPRLRIRSDSGPMRVIGLSPRINDSGTIRLRDMLSSLRSRSGNSGLEFYFTSGISGGTSPVMLPMMGSSREYLVSNTVRQGVMNTQLKARPLTAKEKSKIAEEKRKRLPPPDVPAGHERYTGNPALVPGVTIQGGRAGEWVAAVVARVEGQDTYVRYDDGDDIYRLRPDYVAVSSSDLKRLRDDPSSYRSIVRVLPRGLTTLPDEWTPIAMTEQLPAGVPLKWEKSRRFQDVRFVSISGDNANVIVGVGTKPKTQSVSVDSLAIESSILGTLSDASVREKYKQDLEVIQESTKRIPSSSNSMAKADGGGSSMAAGGTFPETSWPESPTSPFNAANSTTPTIRIWKDATGRFEIKASLVEQSDSSVKLLREDHSIIEVPTAKLSQADQDWLSQNEATEDENPFQNVVEASGNQSADPTRGSPYARSWVPAAQFQELGWGPKSLAISPDRKFLLIGRAGESASLYSLSDGRLLIDSGRMPDIGDVTACGFSPDGSIAVLGGAKGVLDVYGMTGDGKMTPKIRLTAHTKSITCLQFSVDSKYLLTGSEDKSAIFWDLESGDPRHRILDFDGKVKAVCVDSATGQLLATDGKTLKIVDGKTGILERAQTVARSHHSGQTAAFSPNAKLLAVGATYDFRLYNLESMTELNRIEGSETSWTACFAPDSRHLVTGNRAKINIWDAKTGIRVQSMKAGESSYVQALTISDDGQMIAGQAGFKKVMVLRPQSP